LDPFLQLIVHVLDADTAVEPLVSHAIEAGADLVIASGGDGTVSAVANALVGTGIPLGIIPRGTANAFASALSIPSTIAPLPPPIREACEVILAGHSRTVDVARCNGIPMTLLVGIGYEAEMVEKASREMKTRWGAFAYLVAGWQMLNQGELFDVEIEVDNQVHYLQAGAITIANAAPSTSVLAQGAGQVVADDGLLDVTIASAETKLEAIQTMFGMLGAALVNASQDLPNVVHFYAQRIAVTTSPPQKVVMDGELIGTTPVEVESIPGSLQVLVPKTL
jgi:YegS/Rv2252/BmrU family lipid kinase